MLPSYLSEKLLMFIIERALDEDIGPGDVTTLATMKAGIETTASFVAKEDGVLAGLHVAESVFCTLDGTLRTMWSLRDGEAVIKGTVFGSVSGRAGSILTAERTTLNLMQRMSGIATATQQMQQAVYPYQARILDTRKTAPGLRPLDKWAVKLGGGENHRIGLFDMILIKDNHIAAAGSMEQAVRDARRYITTTGKNLEIEVEARTLVEVETVLGIGGVDYIMLDNMVWVTPDGDVDTRMLKDAVLLIQGRIATEASGNVTLDTVNAIAATGVDYISCGALTHSVKALDISLKMEL